MKSPDSISRILSLTVLSAILLAMPTHLDAKDSADRAEQTIELKEGWNLVGLTVRPDDPIFSEIFGPVKAKVVMARDHLGRIWIPDFGGAEITTWDFRQAYYVFARESATLTVSGTPLSVAEKRVELNEGWNTVPFVGAGSTSASSFFGQRSEIVLVRDNEGRTFWPEYGLDEIGELTPGKGYLVFSKSEVSLETPGARPVFRIPSSIDASGNEEVSRQLNAFIAGVPDGATVFFESEARYRVEFPVVLEERRDLVLQGNGALIFATDPEPFGPSSASSANRRVNRTRTHLEIRGSSDVLVRNLRIKGAHPNGGTSSSAYVSIYEAQHGVRISGGNGIVLDSLEITDVYGDFVYLSRYRTDSEWARNVAVRNSFLARNGRQGFGIVGAENILIENNVIQDVRRSVFDIEPNNERGGGVDIVIRDNDIGDARLRWLAAHGRAGRVENIVIEGNRTSTPMNITVEAPEARRRGPFLIKDNVSTIGYGTPRGYLMRFVRTDGVTVVGNIHSVSSTRNMRGVYLDDACDYRIEDNTFRGAIEAYTSVNENCD